MGGAAATPLPKDLDLARATGLVRIPAAAAPLVATSSGFWLGPDLEAVSALGGRPPTHASAPDSAKYLDPLARRAESYLCRGAPRHPSTVVFADAQLPFQTLRDVIHTLGHGFDSIYLAAQDAGSAEGVLGIIRARLTVSPEAPDDYDATIVHGDEGVELVTSWRPKTSMRCLAHTNTKHEGRAKHAKGGLEGCLGRLEVGSPPRVAIAASPRVPTAAILELAAAAARALSGEQVLLEIVLLGEASLSPSPGGPAKTVAGGSSKTAPAGPPGVIATLNQEFRGCYEAHLEEVPSATGRVLLTLHVDAQGVVREAAVSPSETLTPIHDCLRSVALSARFGAQGEALELRVPLHFVPSDDAVRPCWRQPETTHTSHAGSTQR